VDGRLGATRLVVGAVAAGAVLVAGCGGSGGGKDKPTGTESGTAVSAAPAAGGSANGVENLPARQIVTRSVQALKDGHSARAVGALTSTGQRISLDLALDTDANCSGTMSLGPDGSFQLVKVGQDLWLKPDQTFWESHGGSAVAKLVGDKYLKTTADNTDFGDVTSLCDLGQLADSIGRNTGPLTTGPQTTVQGTPAVTVTGTDQGEPGTLYVATQGRPYPLRIEKTSGSESGGIDFRDFGTPVPTTTPSPDQTVDLDQLKREVGSAPSTLGV